MLNHTRISLGMHRDLSPQDQPSNTYRGAWNGTVQTRDGDRLYLSNELSNSQFANLPLGNAVVGYRYIGDGSLVIMTTGDNGSEIGILDSHGNYRTWANDNCLNFRTCNPVDITYRLRKGCDKTIYFTDAINPIRVANLSNDFESCDKLKLFRDVQNACLESHRILPGGVIPNGTCEFAIRFLDEELNPTHFQSLSLPTSFYPLNNNYESIQGKYNLDTDPNNGVSHSGTSIQFNLRNLDTRFAYYQIGVACNSSGTGETSGVFISPPVQFTEDTDSYMYSGDHTSFTQSTIEELQQGKYDLETAEHIDQLDNRLVVANTTGKQVDWCTFQRFASKIRTRYFTKVHEVFDGRRRVDLPNSAPSATSKYYLDNKSYLRGEVYAFGIVYLFNDGFESPVYHIPGRSNDFYCEELTQLGNQNNHSRQQGVTDFWDSQTYNVTVNGSGLSNIKIDQVRHLGFTNDNYTTFVLPFSYMNGDTNTTPGVVPRWMVFNTAIKTGNQSNADETEGYLSYYHCNTAQYSERETCDGEDYWGEDYCGNPLTDRPIRHHKMPDNILESHYYVEPVPAGEVGKQYIRPLGLEFDNIEYPHPDIVSHKIVRVERNSANTTVADKGIIYNSYDRTGIIESNNWNLIQTKEYYSPEMLFNKTYFPNVYMKLELTAFEMLDQIQQGEYEGNNLALYFDDDCSYLLPAFADRYNNIPVDVINLQVYDSKYLSPVSPDLLVDGLQEANTDTLTGEDTINDLPRTEFIYNRAYTPHKYFFYTSLHDVNYDMHLRDHYVTLCLVRDVYCDLFNLRYIETEPCPFTLDDETKVYGGDIYITGMSFSIEYLNTTELPLTLNAGSCEYNTTRYMTWMYFESSINADLRFDNPTTLTPPGFDEDIEDLITCDTYYDGLWENINEYLQYHKVYATWYQYENENLFNKKHCPEYFGYNPDYTAEPNLKIHTILPFTYDCCSKCLEVNVNRVAYSNQSFQEELVDHYRIFLPNNYRDLDGETGRITDIFTRNNDLYVHTAESLWQLPQNFQERVTGNIVTYLGSGDFFGIPPRKVVDSELGNVGNLHKRATIKTPHGVVIVSEPDGKVYLLTDTFKVLSDAGMSNWFEEHLTDCLCNQLDSFYVNCPSCPENVPCCPSYSNSDIITGYDERNDRVLITKRDYEIKEETFFGLTTLGGSFQVPNMLAFDINSGVFVEYTEEDGIAVVEVGDDRYFCDKSWTISYSFITNSWVSWHSYLPRWYMYTRKALYSGQNNVVWKHNHEGYHFQTFYGLYYPFTIEWVDNPEHIQTKIWNHVMLQMQAKRWDAEAKCFVDLRYDTFSSGYMYNSWQLTGLFNLAVRNESNIFNANRFDNVVIIDREERDWRLNCIRDKVTNYDVPLFIKDCVDFRYTDKNINPAALEVTKKWFDSELLRDKFIVIRLSYANRNDTQITFNYGVLMNETSFR